MKVFNLGNWPFALKFAVSPLAGVVMLVVVSAIGALALLEQNARIETISERFLQGSAQLSAIAVELNSIQADIFRLTTLQAANTDGLNVSEGAANIVTRIDGLSAQIATYRDAFADEETASSFDEAIQNLENFKGAVEWVGSMLELDFASSVSFLTPLEEQADAITTLIDENVDSALSAAAASAAEARADVSRTLMAYLGFGVFALVAIVGVGFTVARATTKSINAIADATERVARDDDGVEFESLTRGDELQGIVEALAHFRENSREARRLRREQEAMKRRAEEERKEQLNALAADLDASVAAVSGAIQQAASELQTEAIRMSDAAREQLQRVSEMTSATELASGNVSTVASAAEELTASFREIGQQCQRATVDVNNASTAGEQTNVEMSQLAGLAAEIGSIVETIQEIASQTNLLALNATIESARAGEAGRGFAVVAHEVKGLAGQTAKATDSISEQIQAVRSSTDTAVGRIQEITEMIGRLNDVTNGIASAVTQQLAATEEISESVGRASRGTDDLVRSVDQVHETSKTTESIANVVLNNSELLNTKAAELRTQISDFVEKVRAA